MSHKNSMCEAQVHARVLGNVHIRDHCHPCMNLAHHAQWENTSNKQRSSAHTTEETMNGIKHISVAYVDPCAADNWDQTRIHVLPTQLMFCCRATHKRPNVLFTWNVYVHRTDDTEAQ